MSNDDPMIGQVLGDYKLTRLLGKGGMAYVYQATDQQLGRDVAIKILTLQRDRAKEFMKRFRREARVLSKIDGHPNIITIYRYGTEDDDTHYLAMELIRGETLTQRLGRHRRKGTYMPQHEIVDVLRQVGEALDHAHKGNVIHRDVKPSNIMIEKKGGRVVLMDFGLVMDADTRSTLGTAFGTPRYIAPEQAISSHQAVTQSDLYSLGVILYEMLTCHTPFDEDSAMSLALSHITTDPPSPEEFREDLPSEVSAVVLRALEKQPEDRYQTAQELVEAFEAALAKSPLPDGGGQTAPPAAVTKAKPPRQALPEPTSPPPSQTESRQSEPVPASGSESARRLPIVPIIGAVAIIVVIGALLLLLGGGNDGDNDSQDLRLRYDETSLIVRNMSDKPLDLNGMRFQLADGSYFDSFDFGNQTLSEFVPGRCVVIALANARPPTPDDCEEDLTKNLDYLRKNQQGYFFVWDSSVTESDEFRVMLYDERIATCKIASGSCSFSLPNQERAEDYATQAVLNVTATYQASRPTVDVDGDILLTYNDQMLVVYNASDRDLTLQGLAFSLPDRSARFTTRDFGAQTLASFVPGRCVKVALETERPPAPEYCEDELTKPLYYFEKSTDNLYFVWDSTVTTFTEFLVELNGEMLATCEIAAGECVLSLPETE